MSAIDSYRTLLRIVGPAYVSVAFLGRLPLAMSQVGTLLLVSDASGRYALGGAAAGALALANAIASPVAGLMADRWGQRHVVLVQSLLGAAAMAAIVFVADGSAGLVVGVSALAGVFLPEIGPMARVRWRPVIERSDEGDVAALVNTAFSYEGAADEVSFVLGPALVGAATLAFGPAPALLFAAALLAVFGSVFALHPSGRLQAGAGPHDASAALRLWTWAFVVLVLAQFLIGTLFGSVQTGTTTVARDAGLLGLAGLIHGLLGIGSALSAVALAAVPAAIWYSTRMVAAATALFALSLPLYWVHSIPAVVVVMLFMGCAVAPYMISNFALAGIIVPERRIGTAMTLLAASTGLGYAVGASIAGDRADAGGAHAAYLVSIAATWLMLVLSVTANPVLRRAKVSAD